MLVFFPCSHLPTQCMLAYSLHACILIACLHTHHRACIITLAYLDTCILCTWMLSLFHLHWGTYSVHVVVQVWWKCQCVSVSVEVSVFKGFSGRTLRNAFGKNTTDRSHPLRTSCDLDRPIRSRRRAVPPATLAALRMHPRRSVSVSVSFSVPGQVRSKE